MAFTKGTMLEGFDGIAGEMLDVLRRIQMSVDMACLIKLWNIMLVARALTVISSVELPLHPCTSCWTVEQNHHLPIWLLNNSCWGRNVAVGSAEEIMRQARVDPLAGRQKAANRSLISRQIWRTDSSYKLHRDRIMIQSRQTARSTPKHHANRSCFRPQLKS